MARQRQHVHHDEPIGTAWKEIIERILLEEGRERAAAQARASTGYDVVVRTPITFFVRYAREGDSVAANGEVDCACVITEDVCVCYGPCPDFPECCDEGPIFTEG
jgi:hypothetical protein